MPPGSLLDPPAGAAVVGGNVETSQRVVDVLLAAMGRAAASQGTMNNLAFGDERFGYYETIGGGAGAGPGFAGASGVHVHMTNTRITDPEVLESQTPVIVRRFALRRGSGGAGRWPGGDGLVRELEFTATVTASLLTERRTTAPFGLAGGQPGARGRNLCLRADGARRGAAGSRHRCARAGRPSPHRNTRGRGLGGAVSLSARRAAPRSRGAAPSRRDGRAGARRGATRCGRRRRPAPPRAARSSCA